MGLHTLHYDPTLAQCVMGGHPKYHPADCPPTVATHSNIQHLQSLTFCAMGYGGQRTRAKGLMGEYSGKFEHSGQKDARNTTLEQEIGCQLFVLAAHQICFSCNLLREPQSCKLHSNKRANGAVSAKCAPSVKMLQHQKSEQTTALLGNGMQDTVAGQPWPPSVCSAVYRTPRLESSVKHENLFWR